MTTSVHSRREARGVSASANRAGTAASGRPPVLIRLPDLGALGTAGGIASPVPTGRSQVAESHTSGESSNVASGSRADSAHSSRAASAGSSRAQASTTSSSRADRSKRREAVAPPAESFWGTTAGKAVLALLLLAIALACYSLLTGGGSDNESEAGPEVVWPDPSAQTESQTAWQNRQANATGSTGDDTSDRTRAATDAYMQNTNAPNEAITPPPILDSSGSSNSSDEQAVDDGDLGSGDQAEPYYPGAEASYPALNGAQTPSPEGEPANAAYGPVDSGVPYGDGAYGPAETYGGYSDDSGAAYGDGSQYADTGYPSNQDSPATTSPTISPVSGPTGVAPQPSVPAGQPYVYPDTGYPEFDLRYASRPGERSAQLPASPNGTTEVIQPPTTGQQYERTGSGLY